MRFTQAYLAAFLLFVGAAFQAWPAETHAAAAGHAGEKAGAGESQGLPPAAPILKDFGFFQISSSMVVTITVALLLIAFAQIATRNVKLVPDGAQNFWEYLVESLYSFLEGLLGKELVKKTFWFFASLFIFILFTNWFGLIPGVGTITYGGHPILRGGNADLNMTSAMALLSFVLWIFWSFQALGFAGFFKHIFGAQGDSTGFMKVFMIAVFFFVGVIEVISIMFRPVSLSFRLFGNVFAGENILESMAHLGGSWLGWLLPLPFYFLELLVGLVQALVFTLLTSVFTALMCQHPEHGEHGHGEHAHSHDKH